METEEKLESPLAGLAAGWALSLGVGTAVLHAIGYVSLRFRLRALGVEVDHGVIDERFLFEGARVLLQLLTTLPLLLLLTSPAVLLVFLLRRPPKLRRGIDRAALLAWNPPPGWLTVGGVLWAVLTVHFVQRHVIPFQNLLLDPVPCDPRWLRAVLLDPTGSLPAIYFAGLLALLAPTAFAFARLPRGAWLPARALLGVLLLVQILLVPVHVGLLGAGIEVARLEELPGEPSSSRVWKVFATEETAVFLVERPGPPAVRRLVSLKTEDLERQEIVERKPLAELLRREDQRCGD